MSSDTYLVCTERCGWSGKSDDKLVAPNPFNPAEDIVGCPGCFEVNTLVYACDVCQKRACCGTPTEDGYRWTCSKHTPSPK